MNIKLIRIWELFATEIPVKMYAEIPDKAAHRKSELFVRKCAAATARTYLISTAPTDRMQQSAISAVKISFQT